MTSEQPVKITVDDARHVSGLLQMPEQRPRLPRAGARSRSRDASSLSRGGSRRSGRSGYCDAALPVPVHGTALEAPGLTGHLSCDRARGRHRGGGAYTRDAALRRRQVLRRPHDLAGAGQSIRCPRSAGWSFSDFRCTRPVQPSESRASTWPGVQIEMLFLQGTRDDFAKLELIEPVVSRLGDRAELELFRDADHSFHVPARSGRTDVEVRGDLTRTLATWIDAVIGHADRMTGQPEPVCAPARACACSRAASSRCAFRSPA